MRFRSLVAAVCLLGLATSAEAQFSAEPAVVAPEDFNIELGAMFWTPSPDLVITTSAFAPVGGTVDFVNTFALEDDRFTELRLVLKGGKHKFRAARVVFEYQESATIQGAPATTDIEWELWRVGYEYDFIRRQQGFVGVVTELKYNEVDARVNTPFGRAETLQKVPIPTIGAIGRGYLGDAVSVTAEFTMLSLDRDDLRGKFYDFDLYGTGHFGKSFGVQAGYRSVTTDYLVDDDAGDLKMKGFYFGGLVRF